ncbi:SsrA-binding protein SmpB [Elusimicrobiota bacterium]
MEKKVVATNRKARFNYTILETFEAGIIFSGYEVKSLRKGQANLTDGFITFSNNGAYLNNIHIAPYSHQSSHVIDYNPTRSRKILLHKREITQLHSKVREKGLSLVPLELYFSKRGLAKVLLGLAKGKTAPDKRETLRKKAAKREIEREMKQ